MDNCSHTFCVKFQNTSCLEEKEKLNKTIRKLKEKVVYASIVSLMHSVLTWNYFFCMECSFVRDNFESWSSVSSITITVMLY